MKINLKFILVSIILLVFYSCSKDNENAPVEPKKINLPEKSSVIISNGNIFGIQLFKEVSLNDNGNLMLSPISASVALSMLLNGAGEETYQQIRNALAYHNLSLDEINAIYKSLLEELVDVDPKVTLALANAAWYRNDFPVKPPFLEVLKSSYHAHIQGLDFANPDAVKTINAWASDNTNGKITEVLKQIDGNAVIFLMNALYFKGKWTYTFNPSKTTKRDFIKENGESIQIETMNGELPFKWYASEDFEAFEFSYGRNNFVMDVIMPTQSFNSFLLDFDESVWKNITTALDEQQPFSADVFFPRFKFSYERKLNEALKKMGMIDAFLPGVANLSGIADMDLYVSFVKQNTFVEVNEEGTEAAAVTTVGIDVTSLPQSYAINKPFIFVIRERTTNAMLFIGKVMIPE